MKRDVFEEWKWKESEKSELVYIFFGFKKGKYINFSGVYNNIQFEQTKKLTQCWVGETNCWSVGYDLIMSDEFD